MPAFATITVQYVNPPKEGKKMGSIKASDGTYYGVWPDKLSLFEAGKSYDIEYKTGNFNGRETRTFNRIIETNRQSGSASANGGGSPGDAKALEIFVTGMVGRAIQGSGTVPDGETMAQFVHDAAYGFREGMRRFHQQPETPNIDFDDPIPF